MWRLVGLSMAYHALGRTAESDAALAELIRKYERDCALPHCLRLAYRGEADRAFEWLDKAVEYRDPGISDTSPSTRCSPNSMPIRAGCRSCASSAWPPSSSRRSSST